MLLELERFMHNRPTTYGVERLVGVQNTELPQLTLVAHYSRLFYFRKILHITYKCNLIFILCIATILCLLLYLLQGSGQ